MLEASYGRAQVCCAMFLPIKLATVLCESEKIHVDVQSNLCSDPITLSGVVVDVEYGDV